MTSMLPSLVLVALAPIGQVNLPAAKPVPAMQVLPLPENQASIEREGREIARYYFDTGRQGERLPRPFLYPLVGPSGKSLTRMGHPRDPNGHNHHNSLWISHHDLAGSAFWNDAKSSTGRIAHQRVVRYEDADGDKVALPCTERLLSVDLASHVTAQRFMPLLTIKGRLEVRLGSFQSLAGRQLAGFWAPVAVSTAASAALPSAAADDTSPAVSGVVETPPAAEAVAAAAELNALLASLAAPAAASPAAKRDTDLDPALAALLADL